MRDRMERKPPPGAELAGHLRFPLLTETLPLACDEAAPIDRFGHP